MKLMRYGAKGAEKPALVDASGTVRDLSGVIPDITAETMKPENLRRLARAYPEGEVHVVLDNVSTHKTPDVQAWLARHRRFLFHFTPTSASWLNQVETRTRSSGPSPTTW